MKILQNLSELNKEGIILKDNNDEQKEEKIKEKKNNFSGKKSVNQLSLIKEENYIENLDLNEKKNELEISRVGVEKLEKKKKNVTEIQNLIDKCDEDIFDLDRIIKKYEYSTKDLTMESGIFDDRSMIFINKKEEEEKDDENEIKKRAEYFKGIRKEFCDLKKKLQKLLSLYELEKELTEEKKKKLENLESLNKDYSEIKKKKMLK